MIMNLVREFASRDMDIDLIVFRASEEHFTSIPNNVNIIKLRAKHSTTSIPELKKYLQTSKPAAMLVAKDRPGRAALIARQKAGTNTRIIIRLGTNLSRALEEKNRLLRYFRVSPMRRLYPLVDKVVAVSDGVAEDTHKITLLPKHKIKVIRNPVITNNLYEQAKAPTPHPWLEDNNPVILGSGRLTHQKDFPTLLQAFARLELDTEPRLIILGEGKLRTSLEKQAKKLGISGRCLFPGFQANPYAWLSKASVFVLSSLWEGSPNVLTEALALGIPSVATNCPSGPAEVLQNGKIGPLVACGDIKTMCNAIKRMLSQPPDTSVLKQAVAEYNAITSANRYLDILKLTPQ